MAQHEKADREYAPAPAGAEVKPLPLGGEAAIPLWQKQLEWPRACSINRTLVYWSDRLAGIDPTANRTSVDSDLRGLWENCNSAKYTGVTELFSRRIPLYVV
jgi:hypothetical protein